MDLATFGYSCTALLHTALAVVLYRDSPTTRARTIERLAFVGAVSTTAAWGWCTAAALLLGLRPVSIAASLLDLARYGLWFMCLVSLLRPRDGAMPARTKRFGWVAVAVITAVLALWLSSLAGLHVDGTFGLLSRPLVLAVPVLGLVLVEQLFRNTSGDARWGSKPFCLALALLFTFDIYFFSQAALFGRVDADALSIRGAVHGVCVPLLYVASRRQAHALSQLRVSQVAAFHTATLLLVGVYLLFISAIGYYVRESGGDWGSALQLGLLFVAGVGLIVVLLSESMRAKLRVFIGKHFFSYRYDYRAEWLRFTSMLSSSAGPAEVGVRVIRGLADMVESPAGALWSKGLGGDFAQTSSWNMPRVTDKEAVDSAFSGFLRDQGWIIDVQEWATDPQHYGGLVLPAWLTSLRPAWLVVPLHVGDELIGFVVLGQARTAVPVNWEVRDLLKTAGRQAAGFLAQMHATEALLEVRKFDAFNRMSAFVVHDLKNIVTQLSLMLKNAQRLQGNPEFQRDMLTTVENSLEKMRQLMLQLREGEVPAGGTSGVDLVPIARRIEAVASQRGRAVDVEVVGTVVTRGHEDRIERVLGHVVQNALDATSANDRVWLRLERDSGRAKVVVGDTGRGMTPEFVHTQLFRPFNTTKKGGMGIGAYESFQYVKELGGSIDVDTEVDRGTVVTILLPLFEARHPSDLDLISAK